MTGDLIRELDRVIAERSAELKALEAARAILGGARAREYGALDLDTDPRDMPIETLEELTPPPPAPTHREGLLAAARVDEALDRVTAELGALGPRDWTSEVAAAARHWAGRRGHNGR